MKFSKIRCIEPAGEFQSGPVYDISVANQKVDLTATDWGVLVVGGKEDVLVPWTNIKQSNILPEAEKIIPMKKGRLFKTTNVAA